MFSETTTTGNEIVFTRLEPSKVTRVGTTASMFGVLLYSLLWTTEEIPNTATFVAFTLIYLGKTLFKNIYI